MKKVKSKLRVVGSSIVTSFPRAILDLYELSDGDFVTYEMIDNEKFALKKYIEKDN